VSVDTEADEAGNGVGYGRDPINEWPRAVSMEPCHEARSLLACYRGPRYAVVESENSSKPACDLRQDNMTGVTPLHIRRRMAEDIVAGLWE
jgi:hypothetical protein